MGTFDDQIRSAMQGMSSGAGDRDTQQMARDQVARQLNMQQRGVNSTAYTPPQEQAAPQQQQVPIPAERPTALNEAVDAQVADGAQVPIPAERPAQPDDRSQMLAAKDAGLDPSGGQPPSVAAATGPGTTQSTANEGNGIMKLMMIAGGSVAAVYGLLKMAQQGDKQAAQAVAQSGMSPDQIGTAMANIEQNAPKTNATNTSQAMSPYGGGMEGEIIPPGTEVGPAKMNLNNAADMMDNAVVPVTPRARTAKQLPDSRPKIKARPK